MVAGELQVVEANLDLVTDYDGNLLEPMTTPNAQLEKVNFSHFIFGAGTCCFRRNCFPESWNCAPGYRR